MTGSETERLQQNRAKHPVGGRKERCEKQNNQQTWRVRK